MKIKFPLTYSPITICFSYIGANTVVTLKKNYAATIVPAFSPFPHLYPAPPFLLPNPIPLFLSVTMGGA